jgi:hypothetical protein
MRLRRNGCTVLAAELGRYTAPMMRARLALILASVAIVATPRPACAQQSESLRPGEERAWDPVIGLSLGAPYRESVYFGFARMMHLSTEVQTSRGIAGIAEVGRGGGQLAIARAWNSEGLMSRLQAAVLRTWANPSVVAAGQTFVSVQVQSSFVLGANAGVYWRVHGNAPGDVRFASVRFVVGF